MPGITDYQLKFINSRSEWKIRNDTILTVAPSFDRCGHIGILTGAELFFKLMSVG